MRGLSDAIKRALKTERIRCPSARVVINEPEVEGQSEEHIYKTESAFKSGKGADPISHPGAVIPGVRFAMGPSEYGNPGRDRIWSVYRNSQSDRIMTSKANAERTAWEQGRIVEEFKDEENAYAPSIAFDVGGHPVIAFQSAENDLWASWFDAGLESVQTLNIGAGRSPVLYYDGETEEVVLFYSRTGDLRYRLLSEELAVEHEVPINASGEFYVDTVLRSTEAKYVVLFSKRDGNSYVKFYWKRMEWGNNWGSEGEADPDTVIADLKLHPFIVPPFEVEYVGPSIDIEKTIAALLEE